MKKIVILISGRGSNMEALLAAIAAKQLPVQVAAVLSNRPHAQGLVSAAQRGIATRVVDHQQFADRQNFDGAMAAAINEFSPDLVVLAGFMRILSTAFVHEFSGRLINIHPSLLPAFPGLNTHQQALKTGVRIHGCTVHFVTPTLDHGPIIIQAAVAVHADDDESTLAARVLAEEHRIYPLAVRWFAENRLRIVDGRVALDVGLNVELNVKQAHPGPLIVPLLSSGN